MFINYVNHSNEKSVELSRKSGLTVAGCESLSEVSGPTVAGCESLSEVSGLIVAGCESLSGNRIVIDANIVGKQQHRTNNRIYIMYCESARVWKVFCRLTRV